MPNHKHSQSGETPVLQNILCLLLCVSLCISLESPLARARDISSEDGTANAASGIYTAAKSNTETFYPESYPFCSDDYLYLRNGKRIEQRTLDGILCFSCKVKSLKELWWVDNGWIYYSVALPGNSGEELRRAPISQEEEGERILWNQKENLLTDEYINALCISGSYVVYRGNKTYYRYDLQQKTSLALGCKGKQKYIPWTEFISTLQNVPLVKDGFTFLGNPHYVGHFYCLDIENWKVRKIAGRKLFYDQVAATSHAFFYVSGNGNIWQYNPTTNQSSLFADKKAIDKIIQGIQPAPAHKKVTWAIHEIFGEHDDLYIQVYTYWQEKTKGKADTEEHYRMLILSIPQDVPFEISYEKALSECLKEKSRRQYLQRFDCTAESGEICNIVDGCCILLLYSGGKKNGKRYVFKDGCYSLNTGSFKYITKKDREYYYPDYIGANQKHNCTGGYE